MVKNKNHYEFKLQIFCFENNATFIANYLNGDYQSVYKLNKYVFITFATSPRPCLYK